MVTDFAAQATIALEATRRERQLRELQTALAHVHRVTTMGQLAASIAHELKQPLAAMMINGNTSLRWLANDAPELDEVRQSVELRIKARKRVAACVAFANYIKKLVDFGVVHHRPHYSHFSAGHFLF